MERTRTYLAAVGDAGDIATWSGIPYHFLQAARADGLIDEALPLACTGPTWRRRRVAWNAWRVLTLRGKGGYQYSIPFLEALWSPFKGELKRANVINCFQLFPPSLIAEKAIRKAFYIDMTLKQLFEFYVPRGALGRAIVRDALALEKEGYQAADLVVCHSQWAADSVRRDYGIDPSHVRCVVPGANIDRELYHSWSRATGLNDRAIGPSAPLRLVFVGKYWERKGLDRLLEAILIAQRESADIRLQVIGCPRADLPLHLQTVPNVDWLGMIDKRREGERFVELVSSADVGCLLSRAEAGGMVLREYHALGLIVLGTAVGGAPEHMFEAAGRAFSPTAGPQEIAAWLIELVRRPDEFRRLRKAAWAIRESATWDATVRQWQTFWPAQLART